MAALVAPDTRRGHRTHSTALAAASGADRQGVGATVV